MASNPQHALLFTAASGMSPWFYEQRWRAYRWFSPFSPWAGVYWFPRQIKTILNFFNSHFIWCSSEPLKFIFPCSNIFWMNNPHFLAIFIKLKLKPFKCLICIGLKLESWNFKDCRAILVSFFVLLPFSFYFHSLIHPLLPSSLSRHSCPLWPLFNLGWRENPSPQHKSFFLYNSATQWCQDLAKKKKDLFLYGLY